MLKIHHLVEKKKLVGLEKGIASKYGGRSRREVEVFLEKSLMRKCDFLFHLDTFFSLSKGHTIIQIGFFVTTFNRPENHFGNAEKQTRRKLTRSILVELECTCLKKKFTLIFILLDNYST